MASSQRCQVLSLSHDICNLQCKCKDPCLYDSDIAIIDTGDVPRVNGQLAVSRAFGDKALKCHLRSDPDIRNSDIDAYTDVLILASDGLWKVIHVSPVMFIKSSSCKYRNRKTLLTKLLSSSWD